MPGELPPSDLVSWSGAESEGVPGELPPSDLISWSGAESEEVSGESIQHERISWCHAAGLSKYQAIEMDELSDEHDGVGGKSRLSRLQPRTRLHYCPFFVRNRNIRITHSNHFNR